MKKMFMFLFSLVFILTLVGCIDNSGGLDEIPYGEYDNEKVYSMYPIYVKYNKDTNSKPEFSFKHTFKAGVFSTIENLEDIECESLAKLFSFNGTDEYLIENYYALYFTREETMHYDGIDNVSFHDLFIENGKIYVGLSYNVYSDFADDVMCYFEELILIPKEWKEKIAVKSNYKVNFNIMSYSKMQEFKNAFREQILSQFDDQRYREIYMLDVYGEYSDCLVATAYYEGYAHTDVDWQLTETFGDISITYSGHYPIWVCKDSKLYTLTEAYNNGYLTINDIKVIAIRVSKNKNI